VQGESVRIPFADGSVHRLPAEVSDEAALMLADILPTSYEVGALNGGVRPGDTVVIIGAGPIGLAAILCAGLYSPLRTIVVDPVESRRAAATDFGADVVLSLDDDVAGIVRGCRRAWAPTSPSRPSASRRPSTWPSRWSGPEDGSRTSGCTASRRPCTSRSSGSRT